MQNPTITKHNINKLAIDKRLTPLNSIDDKRQLFGITLAEMRALMALKKQSRAKKNKEFNCFVTDHQRLSQLLDTLKTNLAELPDGTRFQIAICSELDTMGRSTTNIGVEHWFMMDCTIKNNTLHTLTIDAANMEGKLMPALHLLTAKFPAGKHYYFKGKMQHSSEDCQTFTHEHISLLSKINSNVLFKTLEMHTHNTENSLKYFTLKDIDSGDLNLLVPLLRSMQSVSSIEHLTDKTKNQKVSEKGITLHEWLDFHKQLQSKSNKTKMQNLSILDKDRKYSNHLKDFQKNASQITKNYYHRNGLGYISITAKISAHLQKLDKLQMKDLIKDLITCLDNSPKFRDNYFFGQLFPIKAAHYERTLISKTMLENLFIKYDKNELTLDNAKDHFTGIIENYADYLIQCDSHRNLQQLKTFFAQFVNNSANEKKLKSIHSQAA